MKRLAPEDLTPKDIKQMEKQGWRLELSEELTPLFRKGDMCIMYGNAEYCGMLGLRAGWVVKATTWIWRTSFISPQRAAVYETTLEATL